MSDDAHRTHFYLHGFVFFNPRRKGEKIPEIISGLKNLRIEKKSSSFLFDLLKTKCRRVRHSDNSNFFIFFCKRFVPRVIFRVRFSR